MTHANNTEFEVLALRCVGPFGGSEYSIHPRLACVPATGRVELGWVVCRRVEAHSVHLTIGAPMELVPAQVGPSGVFP